MPVADQPQMALDEKVVDDAELEKLLDKREQRKAAAAKARKAYADADEAAKTRIRELDLAADEPIRVGRYLVVEREVAGRTVAFDTDPTTRLSIRLAPTELLTRNA